MACFPLFQQNARVWEICKERGFIEVMMLEDESSQSVVSDL